MTGRNPAAPRTFPSPDCPDIAYGPQRLNAIIGAAVLTAYPRLDVLVNNVGGFWATRHLTADGLERTFAVNHLAAFLLTGLVLDRLKGSAPARILIAVASSWLRAHGLISAGVTHVG